MGKKGNLIGMKYVPNDNSFLLCLSDQYRVERLAGTMIDPVPKETTIVSQPYIFEVKTAIGTYEKYNFINVKYQDDVFRVLFRHSNVNVTIEERIKNNIRNNLGFTLW